MSRESLRAQRDEAWARMHAALADMEPLQQVVRECRAEVVEINRKLAPIEMEISRTTTATHTLTAE